MTGHVGFEKQRSVDKTPAAGEEHGCYDNVRKMCDTASEPPAQT